MADDTRPKIYLANRLYIPEEFVTRKHKKAYTYLFGPSHSDNPEDYVEIKTYREFANGYVGFPRGNLQKIKDVFGDQFKIIDNRALVPHGYPDLEFTGSLTAEQMSVWAEWVDYQYGTVEAPPRWGKTVYMTWVVTRLKQRSLVLAQEDQLLSQFEEEFRAFTNVNELERKHGKKLIGRAKNPQDIFPIVTLSTWQKYDHNLAALRDHRDSWGAVFIDEAHSAASPCYARVINTINAHYRNPVTATPERKDGTHLVLFDVGGPVVAKGVTEQLPVHVKVVKTGVKIPPSRQTGPAFWAGLLRAIMGNKNRNELICRRVLRDARAGHKVLVVTDRIKHIHTLVAMMRDMDAEYCAVRGKHKMQIGVLHGEVQGKKRSELRLDAKSGKLDIVVAYSKIVQLGWNVPAWSSLHSVMPMSNAPNWYQRISRIRTKCSNCPGVEHPDCLKKGVCGKKPPVCHIYLDNNRVCYGCFKTQHTVHERLGFAEEDEYEDVGVNIKRDPNRKGKMIRWTEIS